MEDSTWTRLNSIKSATRENVYKMKHLELDMQHLRAKQEVEAFFFPETECVGEDDGKNSKIDDDNSIHDTEELNKMVAEGEQAFQEFKAMVDESRAKLSLLTYNVPNKKA